MTCGACAHISPSQPLSPITPNQPGAKIIPFGIWPDSSAQRILAHTVGKAVAAHDGVHRGSHGCQAAIPAGAIQFASIAMNMKLIHTNHQTLARRLQCAFTLPEVMVSVCIVSVMFTSLYAGISQGFSIITSARENLRATQIMIEKLEVMRLYTWDQVNSNSFIPETFTDTFVPATTTTTSADSLSYSSSSTAGQGTTYYGKIALQTPASLPAAYSTNLREVVISLTWTNSGITRSREMRSYIGQNGLQKYIY
jgi:Tfp pilus assembly protein PilV